MAIQCFFIIEVLYMSLEYHKHVTKSYTKRIVMVLVDSATVLRFSKKLKNKYNDSK